jgi:hypothetical protein
MKFGRNIPSRESRFCIRRAFAKSVSTVKLSHLWTSIRDGAAYFRQSTMHALIAFNSLNTVRMGMVVSGLFESWSQRPPLPVIETTAS